MPSCCEWCVLRYQCAVISLQQSWLVHDSDNDHNDYNDYNGKSNARNTIIHTVIKIPILYNNNLREDEATYDIVIIIYTRFEALKSPKSSTFIITWSSVCGSQSYIYRHHIIILIYYLTVISHTYHSSSRWAACGRPIKVQELWHQVPHLSAYMKIILYDRLWNMLNYTQVYPLS